MDLNQLHAFVQTARHQGFAAAARAMELDPSQVSRQVAALESSLGLRLFQRTTRRLSLTEAGHTYLARVGPLLDELAFAQEEAQSLARGVSGSLRMTTSIAFGHECIAPLLPTFRALHPQLRLELLMTDANLRLVEDQVDLAVRMASRVEVNAVMTKLMPTRYHVCASPGYVQRAGQPLRPQDLALHDCVLLTLPDYRHTWHFRPVGTPDATSEAVNVQGGLSVSSPLVQRSCVLNGQGPALLADWLARPALADGRLIDLFPDHQVSATGFNSAVWLLYPSRSYLPQKVRVMVDFLKANLAKEANGH